MNIRWPRILTPTHLSQFIRKQKNPITALQLFNDAKSRYPNYHHNGPVYATIISILANTGRLTEMKQVIDQMKDDSCECKDSVFVTAIKTYAKAGLLDEAFSLFKTLGQFNCVNYTESFNTLLRIVLNEYKLDVAHRLFLENSYGWEVKYRVGSLNLLMDALCKINRSDLALMVFQEMNFQCCYPNRASYITVMRGLCKDKRWNEAIHLLYSMLWRISQKGSGGDIIIYRTLLDALCDDGQIEEAILILRKVLKKELRAPKRFPYQLEFNGNDVEAAKVFINEALISSGIPSLTSYTAMAIDFYSKDKIDEADKVLDIMSRRGFRPSLLIYEAKVAALCRNGKVNEAMKVIDEEMVEGNCVPTVKMYKIAVKGLCDDGKSEMAVGYLDKIRKKVGCVADKETYNLLVNGLCLDAKYIDASRILEEMLNESYWPCNETYYRVIKGLCSVGRQYDAVMWLEEMVSQDKMPSPCLWDLLVHSVCSDVTKTDISFYLN